MREIKFRAWDKSCNKMRGVNGIQDCFSLRSDGICNDDYILMQFTGLTDKNGVEIFEGDIVKSIFKYKDEPSKEILAIVKYDTLNPCFVLEYKYQGNGFLCQEYDFIQCGLRTNEVIGNIYENPELL